MWQMSFLTDHPSVKGVQENHPWMRVNLFHHHSNLFKHSQSCDNAVITGQSGLSKFPFSTHNRLGQVKLPSILWVDPLNLRPWTLSYQPTPVLLRGSYRCLCTENTSPFFSKSFYIWKHLMPSILIPSSRQEAQGYRPCCSQGRKEHHNRGNSKSYHVQLHSSQKTVYICSPHRTYFKVTK